MQKRNLICRIFGHGAVVNLDTDAFQADCGRCGTRLEVGYDPMYGETLVYGEVQV